jgi:hypothetical protein
MIASHGVATALSDLLPAHQLARIAGPRADVQERRDPRAATRGRGLAPTGRPAPPLLAGPRRALGAGPAAPHAAPPPSIRDAGEVAALASAAALAALDQTPPPARSTGDPRAATAVDPAAGPGEPALGLPAHPRRAQEARHPRVGHHDPYGATRQRAPTRPDGPRSPGEHSFGRRPPASSPPTSSPWRRCASRPSTCCSSSNCTRGRFGLLASPTIRTELGWWSSVRCCVRDDRLRAARLPA